MSNLIRNLAGIGCACALVLAVAVGSASATVVTFQQGVDSYAGTADTRIAQEAGRTNQNYGGEDAVSVHHFGAVNKDRTALIEFDDIFGSGAGHVPVGQPITSAKLRMYLYSLGSGGNGQTVTVSPMLVDVPSYGTQDGGTVPGDVTWSHRIYNTDTWAGGTTNAPVAGSDFDDSVQVTAAIPGSVNEWMEWDITSIARDWQSGALANNDLYLYPGDMSGITQVSFRSSEYGTASLRPQLVITYVPEPSTLVLLTFGAFALGMGLIRRRRAEMI